MTIREDQKISADLLFLVLQIGCTASQPVTSRPPAARVFEIELTHGKPGAHYGSRSTQDVAMRFTVHAEQSRGPVEFHRATAFEAITTGWELMDAGATGLYIYDDEMDAVYWPDEFAELHMITVAARPAIRMIYVQLGAEASD